jgi:hypothetical protein
MNESTHHLQDMIGLFYVVRNVLIQHSSTLLCGSNHVPTTTCTYQSSMKNKPDPSVFLLHKSWYDETNSRPTLYNRSNLL